jgi:hypothetical protein
MNIKELAEQANGDGGVDWYWDELERFAKLVAAHEREECAKLCDNKFFGLEAADAIRARSKA